MTYISNDQIVDYVEAHIDSFHNEKVESINKLKFAKNYEAVIAQLSKEFAGKFCDEKGEINLEQDRGFQLQCRSVNHMASISSLP